VSRFLASLALGVAACAGSCGPADEPTFLGLEVWEGFLANPGEPVLQRRIDPRPDGTFVLRLDTLYLARVTVRTSGRAERCLFLPVFYSWTPGSRSYECHPEVQDGPMTIDVPFGTWTADVQRVTDHYLQVQLSEHGPERQPIATYDTRRYEVSFTRGAPES
jgi:hypothetical protein